MELDLQVIRQQVVHATKALLEQANLKAGDIFVLGCSSSEICGGHIGKASSEEVGQVVIDAILPVLRERGIFLAVQGCEHINRSLVVEREAAERYDLEIVTVKPALHAGGACAVAAYDRAEDPVMVEHITAKAGDGDHGRSCLCILRSFPQRDAFFDMGVVGNDKNLFARLHPAPLIDDDFGAFIHRHGHILLSPL